MLLLMSEPSAARDAASGSETLTSAGDVSWMRRGAQTNAQQWRARPLRARKHI